MEAAAIEAARRESGFAKGGYGVYVAAGMPGYDPDKHLARGSTGQKIRRVNTDGIVRNGRTCIMCGAPLRGTQRRYCGPICRYKKTGKKELITDGPRKCAVCGKPLDDKREGALYCSQDCASRAYYERKMRKGRQS